MKTRWLPFLLFAIFALSACAAAPATSTALQLAPDQAVPQPAGGSGVLTAPSKGAVPPSNGPTNSYSTGSEFASVSSQTSLTPRLVVKNASLEIIVGDPTQAMQAISDMAGQMQGFVVSSNSFIVKSDSGADVPQAKITVRVPVAVLDQALAKIRALVKNADTDIRNQNVTGQDVTEDYVDLNSQLTNLQATEKQLQQIMESAAKTEDVLAVFQQLSSVRQQIDVIQGKIKFYEQSASLSAIEVSILSQASVAPLQIAGWQPVGIARDAAQALINAGKILAEIVIWLVIFIAPIGLVIFFPLRYLLRLFRRNRSHMKPEPAQIK